VALLDQGCDDIGESEGIVSDFKDGLAVNGSKQASFAFLGGLVA